MIEDAVPEHRSDFSQGVVSKIQALMALDIGLRRSLSICFPACVYNYDRTTHKVQVMPLVKQGFFNDEWVYIRRSPFWTSLRNIQCGGFTIDTPVFIGDTGWVISSDRDTFLLKQEGALTNSVLEGDRPIDLIENNYQQVPTQAVMHEFVHGFFIPDNWGKWETHRFKDDFGISLTDALYIGSSIDTEDENSGGNQKGNTYENQNSSSFVLKRAGGAYILSSTNRSQNKHARIAVEGDSVELSVSDQSSTTPNDTSVSLGTDNGLVVRRDNPKDHCHFITSIQDDSLLMRLVDVPQQKVVTISFAKGELNIKSSDAINVYSEGEVNIKSGKDAHVTATNVRVLAEGEATVSANDISATAVGNMKIAVGGKTSIAAAGDVSVTTEGNASITAKKEQTNINISTLARETPIAIQTRGDNSPVTIRTDQKDAHINLVASGANLNLEANEISLRGSRLSLSGAVSINGYTDMHGGLKSDSISVGGSMTVGGSTTIRGQSLTYDSKGKHWV